MNTFAELAASRRAWIDNILQPWCVQVERRQLLLAHEEWNDIAGRVAPEDTLWTWAWSRFPDLVHDGLAGVNETRQVKVTLNSGDSYTGFPDGRKSERGQLVLISSSDTGFAEHGPWSIDDIAEITVAKQL